MWVPNNNSLSWRDKVFDHIIAAMMITMVANDWTGSYYVSILWLLGFVVYAIVLWKLRNRWKIECDFQIFGMAVWWFVFVFWIPEFERNYKADIVKDIMDL
jgi:hypothetical protein